MAGRVRISVRDLRKTFVRGAREVVALDGVSFDVAHHELVALVGPSGCGKSTVLNLVGALLAPTAGEVQIDGVRVADTAPPQVGYVFQKDTVFPWRTVEQNVGIGLEYRGVPATERKRRVKEAIALAGLEGFEDAFPATLSGGMRQRVALLRSLIVDPEILLMDEPFGALDTHTKLQLHGELLRLWAAKQQTVLFVTHDLSEAITLADRVVVMTRRPGRIKAVFEVGLPRPRDPIALRESPEYLREYGRIWHALGEELRETTA
jgi:NitT/TauT family transport system ATP-binding protein